MELGTQNLVGRVAWGAMGMNVERWLEAGSVVHRPVVGLESD